MALLIEHHRTQIEWWLDIEHKMVVGRYCTDTDLAIGLLNGGDQLVQSSPQYCLPGG